MPNCTHSSSTKKSHKRKSKTTTTTTTKTDIPQYYYHYPPADLSSEEHHRPLKTNYATPYSFHQPYQYQYFSHFYYPIHQYDTTAAIRQSLEAAFNAQAQAYANQQRQKETQAAQQRINSDVASTVQTANPNVYQTQPRPPPVIQPLSEPNVYHMNNYSPPTGLDGGSACAWRPAARQTNR